MLVVLFCAMHSLSTPAQQRVNPPPFNRIGILFHPKKPESRELAEEMAAYLAAEGIGDIWLESAWEPEAAMAHLPHVDLLITLGGDGTLLRAARMGAKHEVPMLGVKMGRLGFLAEVPPQEWRGPLDRMLSGDYWLEQRLMIRVHVERRDRSGGAAQRTCVYDALNDVVLSRGNLARVVRISADCPPAIQWTPPAPPSAPGPPISTISGGSGEEKRPMRTATGERPVMRPVRAGTHCGAIWKALSKRIPSRAKRSRFGVCRTGLP